MKPTKECSIDGCNKPSVTRGWCNAHYLRWREHGTTLSDKPILQRHDSPEEAFAAYTSRSGDCLIWVGSKKSGGYGAIWVHGALAPAHRWEWERTHGPIADGKFVDHICHNRACVEITHLRLVTNAENLANRKSHQHNSRTGHRNVYWRPRRNKWEVLVTKNNKQHHYGYFNHIEQAIDMAAKARTEMFGEYAGKG